MNNVIKLINGDELRQLFSELQKTVQNKIIFSALRQSGEIIKKEAKANFQGVKKNKSSSNYKEFYKSFKVEPLKDKDLQGVKVGIKNYKAVFINSGTNDRFYNIKKRGLFRKKNVGQHYTGKIQATNFFNNAVESKTSEAQKNIENAINQEFIKTIEKYNKKYR